MNENNKKEEKKGGAAIPGLLNGGSSAMSGGASGLGGAFGSSGGWLSGLFASKAGILGMVLGGATLAAGVGVVYNFIGPSSKPVYNPDLFQSTYIEDEAARAGAERAQSRDASAAASSTLDMFREQAKKDGLGLGGEGEGGEAADAAKDGAPTDASSDASAEAPSAPDASASGSTGARLQAQSGFGSKLGGGAGGSGTSIPRMQGMGGLSGGIGAQFQPVYRAPATAGAGKTSGMTAMAARVKNSPKYSVPNANKKGAYGQAKFAGKMGNKAAYTADGAGARTGATEAFSGETGGSGDVATPNTGAGLAGAGVSNGSGLKGNDPSLNTNESTPPKVPDPEDVDPWQKYEDMAMKGMMIAIGCILVAKILAKIAKGASITPPVAAALHMAAVAFASAAIAAAGMVIFAGMKMFSGFGQKMMGGIYMLTGAMLIMKAMEAIGGSLTDASKLNAPGVTGMDGQPVPLFGESAAGMASAGSTFSSIGGALNGM